MFGLSFWEIAVVLVVALLVLGPERLPKMLRSVGRGMRELRQASAGLREAIEEPLQEIKRPLQDMRDDLAGTVYQAVDSVRQEAERVDAPAAVEGQLPGSSDHAATSDQSSLPAGDEPGEPVVEPGEPVVEPGEPVVEPGEPVVEPGEPVVEPGEPVVEPGERGTARDS